MKLQHNIVTRAVLAKTEKADMVMVMTGKKMMRSILAMLLIASLLFVSVEAGSDFADSLAECSAVQELNICLREVVNGCDCGGYDGGDGGSADEYTLYMNIDFGDQLVIMMVMVRGCS